MQRFLVEVYVPQGGGAEIGAATARLRAAARRLRRDGTLVRIRHAVLVPDDETCFYDVDAPSARSVSDLAARADVELARVVPARAPHLPASEQEEERCSPLDPSAQPLRHSWRQEPSPVPPAPPA